MLSPAGAARSTSAATTRSGPAAQAVASAIRPRSHHQHILRIRVRQAAEAGRERCCGSRCEKRSRTRIRIVPAAASAPRPRESPSVCSRSRPAGRSCRHPRHQAVLSPSSGISRFGTGAASAFAPQALQAPAESPLSVRQPDVPVPAHPVGHTVSAGRGGLSGTGPALPASQHPRPALPTEGPLGAGSSGSRTQFGSRWLHSPGRHHGRQSSVADRSGRPCRCYRVALQRLATPVRAASGSAREKNWGGGIDQEIRVRHSRREGAYRTSSSIRRTAALREPHVRAGAPEVHPRNGSR